MCIRSMCGSRESSGVTGRESRCQSGWGRPRPQSQHVRFRAVGQAHITREAIEQGFFNRGSLGHGPAEMVEGRGLTKGTCLSPTSTVHSDRGFDMENSKRVREAARRTSASALVPEVGAG